ncbi:MAG TPA: class I SAM-dependent methyltransferase [Candidatus Acidoferrales bacterium]|nr:class I SAM-dependent methyltransferase [Candidatus Acidoferrales bacterium]
MKNLLHKINGAIKRIILYFYSDAFPQQNTQLPDDPERMSLYPYCIGLGIDVGCGSRKTHPNALGVDLTPKGVPGKHGSERRQFSQADICASGDNLYMFVDGTLDYVVARHNLEHYVDPVKTLKEWKRVLKKGGILGIVIPDEGALDTIKLDPTHKHAFTKESFKNMLETIGGFKIIKLTPCIKQWSFVCVAKKIV